VFTDPTNTTTCFLHKLKTPKTKYKNLKPS
jgi:hypothetical protein